MVKRVETITAIGESYGVVSNFMKFNFESATTLTGEDWNNIAVRINFRYCLLAPYFMLLILNTQILVQ
jgi:hypothetical protein